MPNKISKYYNRIFYLVVVSLFYFSSQNTFTQSDRFQIPKAMQQSYFEINLGFIDYPFSAQQIQPGFTLTKPVEIPHVAVRLILAGYKINSFLSAQITYMRPVNWVKYYYSLDSDVTQQEFSNSVWMNVGGFTLKARIPISSKFDFYGEAGFGLITRHGFEHYNGIPVVTDFTTGNFLFGGGFRYQINNKWTLQLCSNFSPSIKKYKQPYTYFLGTGFQFSLQPRSIEKIKYAVSLERLWPLHWLQVGYTSNSAGYGVNNFLSEGPVPIFWGGKAEVKQGISINYQRNIFHGSKIFALDWGINVGYWQTNLNQENFLTCSIFPVFRFNFLHAKWIAPYFYYTVAGPTFMSKKILDNYQMGAHFTFMDNMGIGFFIGKEKRLNTEFKIGHFSNGNIFTENKSVKVPLTLMLGYAF